MIPITLKAVVKESANGTSDGVKLINMKYMIPQMTGKTIISGMAKSCGM